MGSVPRGLSVSQLSSLAVRTLGDRRPTACCAVCDCVRRRRARSRLLSVTVGYCQVRTLEEAPDDEARCCICCCEFVAGDRLMTLHCTHEYHLECIGTWLRNKSTCPLCNQPAIPPAVPPAAPPTAPPAVPDAPTDA